MPDAIIRAVKDATEVILVVGGGIRTPQEASKAVVAGADIVVTGTLVETSDRLKEEMSSLIKSVHS